MSKKQQAAKFAEEIKRTYGGDSGLSDVVVCWNLSKAKKYGWQSWREGTVVFACVFGDNVFAVPVPISTAVLFSDEHDNTDMLLYVVGRYIMRHLKMVIEVQSMRAINEAMA